MSNDIEEEEEENNISLPRLRFRTLRRILWISLGASLLTGLLAVMISFVPDNDPIYSNRVLEFILAFLLTSCTTIIGVFIGSSLEK